MKKILKNTLITLAIVSLLTAIFAFFFPVKSNFISGHLDNGKLFTRDWFTYAYEVVGGYLLILAAACCAYAAMQLYQQRSERKELLFWSILGIILVLSLFLAGGTLLISSLPGVPIEIQSALGTQYVNYRVAKVVNIPQILSSICIVLFGLSAVVFSFLNSESNTRQAAHEVIKSK